MEKIINENGVVDTPIELLIVVLLALIAIIVLFKIANFLESLPVVEKKKKTKKVEVSKESESKSSKTDKKKSKSYIIEKEVDDKKKTIKTETVSKEVDSVSIAKVEDKTSTLVTEIKHECPYASGYIQPIMFNQAIADNKYENNYLYDRFVDNPTTDDVVMEKKISDAFISESELKSVQNYSSKIKVNEVESLDKKAMLHEKISQMTSRNSDKRERLLQEFEGLSKEMKLLIIDNIIQKM